MPFVTLNCSNNSNTSAIANCSNKAAKTEQYQYPDSRQLIGFVIMDVGGIVVRVRVRFRVRFRVRTDFHYANADWSFSFSLSLSFTSDVRSELRVVIEVRVELTLKYTLSCP